MKKIRVKEYCKDRQYCDFKFKLEMGNIRDMIADLEPYFDGGWTHIELDSEPEEYPYHIYFYRLYKYREETDEEYHERMLRLQNAENKKAFVQRLELYEQLKNEFEQPDSSTHTTTSYVI